MSSAVETSRKAVDAATTNFVDLGIDPNAYRFVSSKIFAALKGFAPEQFDVILCKGVVEHCQSVELFQQFSRLRPKHVILDTRISPGDSPITRFALAKKSMRGRRGRITSTPTHDLIAFLSHYDFQCRLVDWQAMGIEDWTGVPTTRATSIAPTCWIGSCKRHGSPIAAAAVARTIQAVSCAGALFAS